VFSLTLECPKSEAELISAELWDAGARGIQEEDQPGGGCRLRAWFTCAEGLMERFFAFQPRIERERETDWEAVARQAWQPHAVGERFWLAPEWDESQVPAGRLRLTIHPGLALGTGAHPATQLCLMAMERHLSAGEFVLDVGTGSGILVSGALLLGARAAGCDIEHDAVSVAKENLRVDGRAALLFTGSLRAVRAGAADVIVANINAAAHQTLMAEYRRVARRLLIVSGLPPRHKARVLEAAAEHGWRLVDEIEKEEWECVALCKEEPS
jgi:ribosomal protein L11 methyltransferase